MARHNVDIRIGAKDHASKVFKRVAIAAGTFLSFRAIGRFAKASTAAFIEQEKSTIKLAAALRATGHAAGWSQKQLSEYANELQNVTTTGNEAFETAMSVMATFRNVTGDVFKESIMLSADLAAALGTNLQGAVIQLGKALNDPKVGLTLLNRSGITFSETQKEMINNLVDSNDLMGAQRIILDEISNQFGGQAKAQADSFGGSIAQLANAFGDLQEKIGEAIANIPGFQEGIKTATLAIQNFGLTWDVVWLQMQATIIDVSDDLIGFATRTIPKLAINLQRFMSPAAFVADMVTGGAGRKKLLAMIPDGAFQSQASKNIHDALGEASDKLAEGMRKILEPPTPTGAGGKPNASGDDPWAGLWAGLFKDLMGESKGGARKRRGGLAADESRFLTRGRGQDMGRIAMHQRKKAEQQRDRQEALQERMTELLTVMSNNLLTVTNFG